MSQSPRRDEPTLDLEVMSVEELQRVLIIEAILETQQQEEEFRQPPPKRRCDSAQREILRQPFLLDQ